MVSICMYICICICVYMCVYLSLSLSLYIYIYIYIYTHTHIHMTSGMASPTTVMQRSRQDSPQSHHQKAGHCLEAAFFDNSEKPPPLGMSVSHGGQKPHFKSLNQNICDCLYFDKQQIRSCAANMKNFDRLGTKVCPPILGR